MKIPEFKTRPNGVPILSSDQINKMADRIARDLQPELYNHQIDAVNLSVLMKNLEGWHYAGRWLSRSGSLLGATIFEAGTTLITDEQRKVQIPMQVPAHTILIDRGLYDKGNEKTFRFTLGHEIGHALLHEAFSCRKENMQAYKNQSGQRLMEDRAVMLGIREHRQLQTDYDWIEWQANAFSSSLLMPETLVFRVRDLVFEENADELKNLNELCITLMDVFRVSHTAAFYRMKELGILPETCRRLPNGMIVQKNL